MHPPGDNRSRSDGTLDRQKSPCEDLGNVAGADVLDAGPNLNGLIADTLRKIQSEKPVEMTVTRVGSYYDFYLQNVRVFGANLPVPDMTDQKIFLYSDGNSGGTTWDRVRAAPKAVGARRSTRALHIYGGLEAAPSGADFEALNVDKCGGSANHLDFSDILTLLRQGD